MKKFLILSGLICLTGVSLINKNAVAQDTSACFLRDSSGRVMDLSSLCGQPSAKPTNLGVFYAQIKRRDAGTPIIDVKFNNQQKFEMLLDTGASLTMITPQMAKALRVVPVGIAKAQVASGDIVEFPLGRIAAIEVGGAIVRNVMVSIGPVPLLGQNFFESYDVTIKKNLVEFRTSH